MFTFGYRLPINALLSPHGLGFEGQPPMQKSRAGTTSREVLCAAGALLHLRLVVLATSGWTSSDTVEVVSRSLHCRLVLTVWLLSGVCSAPQSHAQP